MDFAAFSLEQAYLLQAEWLVVLQEKLDEKVVDFVALSLEQAHLLLGELVRGRYHFQVI